MTGISSEDHSDEEFDYDGYLLFSRMFTADLIEDVEVSEGQRMKEGMSQALPTPSADSDDLRSGYQDLNLNNFISNLNIVADGGKYEIVGDTVAKKYTEEKKGSREEVILDNDTRASAQVVESDNAYLYCITEGVDGPDGVLTIQGSQPNANAVESDIVERFGRDATDMPDIRLNPIEFDRHFFFWLLCQYHSSEKIGNGISVSSINKVKIKGGADFFGEEAEVTNSANMIRSTALIEGLFKNKLPVRVEATFDVDGDPIVADINEKGRIHLKSEKAIGSSTKVERVLLGLDFVRRLTTLYNDWKFYNPADKYVSPLFVETLHDVASSQQVDIDFRVEVVEELVDKRNESLDDWDLDLGGGDGEQS